MNCECCNQPAEDLRGAGAAQRLCSGHVHAFYRWLGSSSVTSYAISSFIVLLKAKAL